MAVDGFYIDIENSSGTRQGAGPITSATYWTYTARMDRAGSFAFAMPASDDMAAEVQKKRVVRAYALLGDTWTEVGAGVIDSIDKSPQPDGTVLLSVSGESEERELAYRSVGFLELESSGAAITHSAAVSAIAAYAPSGWTITAAGSPGNNSIYGRYAGESVLAALVKLGEKSQAHFYRSGAKALTFAGGFTSSGVRAIRATGDLTDETCAIVGIQERYDTHDLITRIYPFGAGQGRARLTLAAASRTAGAGFTLSKTNNYIENDTAEATYGRIEQYVEYKDVAPISNSDADLQSAANMLYDVALEELKRRSTELEQATYGLQLAQCSALLRPMQTLRVVYWDPDAGMDVDADLNILEATLTVDTDGLRTTSVVVSNYDRWPETDSDIVASEMAQGMVFQAHPQLNANSYTTSYNKHADVDENATVYFRLGDEVAQVQQVVFDFQLLPLESTIRSVAAPGTTAGSGELTTQAATGSTGNPSNNTSGVPSDNTSGTPSTNTSGTPSTNTSGTPSVTNTGTPSSNTSGTPSTNTSGAPSVSTTGSPSVSDTGAPSTNTSGSPSTNTSGDSGTLETDEPNEGGDIDADGEHSHHVEITLGAASVTYPVGFGAAGTAGGLVSTYGSGSFDLPTNQAASHTHDIGTHTHDLASHTHSLGNHTHTISHSHSLNSHTHSLNNHTHDLGNHTHDLGSHTHNLNSHTHTLNNHTHTLGNHTHSLNNHTHDLNNHAHAFDVKISTLFGIFRESSRNTAGADQMEYRVNSGTWVPLDTAITSLGGDWYRLDVTDDVVDSDTLRPVQASNEIEFRISDQSGLELLLLGDIEVVDGTATADILEVYEAVQAGDRIEIEGSDAAGEDGIHIVTDYDGSTVEWRTTGYDASDTLTGALVTRAYTVQIDGLLSVRNTIQAVAYT